MPILSNTPGVRYITIQGMVVGDGGVLYPISSFETCDKYIYWNRSTPFKLQSSNKLEATSDLCLVALNKNGVPTMVNQTDIEISFSENINNSGVSNGDITGIIEKVDENTTKIASIVKDIDGINSTVGKVTEDLKVTNEKVSNVQQTADGLVTTVTNLTTEYNDDKEFNLLKENITSTMINQSTLLGELSSIFKEVSKDNNLNEEEKTRVRNKKSEVEVENTKLIGFITQLIDSLHEQGMVENETKLTRAKDSFVTSYNNVSSIIDTTLSTSVVVPTQISTIINGISAVVVKLTSLKDVCDDIIFLGTGGVIYEELAKINVTSSSIQQTVSSIKESIKSNLSIEKGKLQSQIEDLESATNRFDVVIKEVYIDGTVTAAEKVLITDRITSIEKEMNDVIVVCDTYLNSEFISPSMKTTLQKCKNDLNTLYISFKNELTSIISDDFFNESEKNNLDAKFKEFVEYITVFHNTISLSIDDVEKNRYEKEINDAKTLLQTQIDELQNDLSNMDNEINTTFKDNIIDEMERARISQNVLNLNLDKSNIDNQYNQLYKNVLLIDPLKSEFRNVYNSLSSSYNNLLKILNDILAKTSLITNQDKINIDNGYADLTSKTSPYTVTANKVIEFIANAESEQAKNQFQESINDLHNQLGNIGVNIDGAFADMKLDEKEKIEINSKLLIIETDKVKVDTVYNEIYNNTKLTDLKLKDNLKVSYDEFILKYNNFKSSLKVLTDKQVEITVDEKNTFNNSIIILSNSIKEFTDLTMTCCEVIGKEVLNELTLNFINAKLGLIDKLVEFTTLMGDSIFDKLLDDVDKSNIINKITELNVAKDKYTEIFTSTYINSNLDEVVKNSMAVEKSLFDSKYNLMIDSVNVMVEFNGELTDELENNYKKTEYDCKIQHGVLNLTISSADTIILNDVVSTEKDKVIVKTSDICSSIRDLDNFMNGVFKDEILDATEKTSLKNNLDIFKSKKLEVDKIHEQTYGNKYLNEIGKLKLKLSYDEYESKYLLLVEYIDLLLNTQDKVNEENKLQLVKRISEHNSTLSVYIESYNVALDEISQGYTESTKDTLQQQISNVNNSVNDLENTMNGVFQDSVLTEAEKLAIKERLRMLQVEKVNIDKQYEVLFNNKDLVDVSDSETAKTNLTTTYDNLNVAYTSLVNAINVFVNLEGIVDDSHRVPVTNGFNEYKVKLGEYSTRVNESVDAIAKKKVNDEAAIREEKIVKLTQDLDGFKLSVSETYSKKSDVDVVKKDLSELTIEVGQISSKVTSNESNLTDLTGRVTSAEEKITTDAIINTVSSATTSDGNKMFAESSEITQKVNEVEMKFTQSGGYNLLYNGDFRRDGDMWGVGWLDHVDFLKNGETVCPNGISVRLRSGIGQTNIMYQHITSVKNSTDTYTFSYWTYVSDAPGHVDGTTNPYRRCEISINYADGTTAYNSPGDVEEFNKWVKKSITIKSDKKINQINISLINRDTTRDVYYSEIQVEKGEIANKYTSNPNEVYDGITQIDRDGVKVEMIEGDVSKGYARMNYDGFSIHDSKGRRTSWFGSDDSAYIDTLTVNKINEPTLIKWSRDRPREFWVNTTATGDGSGRNWDNQSNSINHTLDYIWKTYGCYSYRADITINVLPGTYQEDVYIGGWVGTGGVTIKLYNGVDWYGYFLIEEMVCPVEINGGRTAWDTNNGAIIHHDNPIQIRSSNVKVRYLRAISSSRGAGTFITATNNSHVNCEICDIVNYGAAISGWYSYFHFADVRGVVNYICYEFTCLYAYWQASRPYCIQAVHNNNWNSNISISDSVANSIWYPYIPDTPPPPPPPTENWQWTEQTFNLGNLRTVPEGSGATTSGKTGMWGQGHWGSYKEHRGYADINGASSWCSGGRNFNATITLRRWATNHGQYGEIPTPVINGWNTGTKFALGQTKTITIPSWLVTEIANGNVTTLNMYNPGTSNYSFYDFSSITIKCEKNFI